MTERELAHRAQGEAIRDLLTTDLGVMTDAALTWNHRIHGQDGTDLVRRRQAQTAYGWTVILTIGN